MKRGVLWAVLSSLCFGASGPFGKALIGAGFSPLQAAWLRIAGAALILLPLALAMRGPRGFSAARPHAGRVVAYGLTGVVGCQALFFVAASRLPVGIASLLEFTGPVVLLLWVGVVRRAPVRRGAAAGIAVAVVGLACVVEVWSGLSLDAIGLAAGLGSAACQAAYFLLVEGMTGQVDPLVMTAGGMVVGAPVLAVVAAPWNAPWHVLGDTVAFGTGTAPAWALALWVIVVSTVVAYVTGCWAVQLLDAQPAAAIGYTEAVAATVIAWVVLGEHLTAFQVAGGVVVLSGAYIAQRSVEPRPSPVPVAA
ncbi:DMT family transporter [Actinocorallia longicatena]|uniref:EamA family transporter n=1 Tax=Actinocorallia longicatena TaxID=111803 RepID=A0ABP6PV34_9ACTN